MHTVIVGGGIAGIKAAREISRRGLGKVTLISQNSDLMYHSMLYAAATGSPANSVSLDTIFADDSNVEVVIGPLENIDVEHKRVSSAGALYNYDSLILALGASVNFFDVPGADQYSFSIETIKKANELRRHIHDDIAVGHQLEKHYVIVGGGLTGVELAGAFGTYIHKVAAAHGVTKGKVRVILVEQEDRLLPLCSRTASAKAMRRLKKLGVSVRLGQRVDSLTGEFVVIDGKKIPTRTVVWACGSRGNPLFLEYPRLFKTADDGRVIVDSHLEAHDHIYVIGDSAALPYSGRVSSALREASYIARYLERKMHKQAVRAYKPSQAATCVRIGDKWAYVEKYGIYAAGTTGYAFSRFYERLELEKLLPNALSDQILHTSAKAITDCGLCDT